MATKKDFSKALENPLASSIETATAQPAEPALKRRPRNTAPTAAEVQQAREMGRTQGREGVKALRINMAFKPEIYDFIKRMAIFRGETITDFCNHILELYMEEHKEDYNRMLDFIDRT